MMSHVATAIFIMICIHAGTSSAMQPHKRNKGDQVPGGRPPLVPKPAWGLPKIADQDIVSAIVDWVCGDTVSSAADGGPGLSLYDFVRQKLGIALLDNELIALIQPHEKKAYKVFFRMLFMNAHDHGGFLLVRDMIDIYKESKGTFGEVYAEVLQLDDIRLLYERQPIDVERALYLRARRSIDQNEADFKRILVARRATFEEEIL